MVVLARIFLAALLVVAGVGKLLDPRGSRDAIFGFGTSRRVANISGYALPIVELIVALGLLFPQSAQWSALAACLLFAAFVAGIMHALRQERTPQCHCFGVFHSAPAGRPTIYRNLGFAAVGVIAAGWGPGPSLSHWFSTRSAAELTAIALGILAAALSIWFLRLWREHRDVKLQLDEAQAKLDALPPGLPVGARAPRFKLPEVQGGTVTLEELCSRGLPVLLVFLGRGCGPSIELTPSVARWQRALSERLTIAVVSRGGPEHNYFDSVECGIVDIALQYQFELVEEYRVPVTPAAVLISPLGQIEAPPALGTIAIEELVRRALGGPRPTQALEPPFQNLQAQAAAPAA